MLPCKFILSSFSLSPLFSCDFAYGACVTVEGCSDHRPLQTGQQTQQALIPHSLRLEVQEPGAGGVGFPEASLLLAHSCPSACLWADLLS